MLPTMNIGVQSFVWKYAFSSLEFGPRSGIDGSYGDSFSLFEELPDYFLK